MHTTSIAMWRAIQWTFDIQIVIALHKQISRLQLYLTDFVKIFIYFHGILDCKVQLGKIGIVVSVNKIAHP